MYYVWNGWWWWFVWLLPTLLILWVIFGWSGRRYGYGPYASRQRYPYDMDDVWVGRFRGGAARRHRNRAPMNYRRSDTRIQEDVCDRLMLEDELDPSAIDVRVESGVVSLAGTVATRLEKRLAEQIADSVPGVTDVDNRLRIGKPATFPQAPPAGAASSGQSSTASPGPVSASPK